VAGWFGGWVVGCFVGGSLGSRFIDDVDVDADDDCAATTVLMCLLLSGIKLCFILFNMFCLDFWQSLS